MFFQTLTSLSSEQSALLLEMNSIGKNNLRVVNQKKVSTKTTLYFNLAILEQKIVGAIGLINHNDKSGGEIIFLFYTEPLVAKRILKRLFSYYRNIVVVRERAADPLLLSNGESLFTNWQTTKKDGVNLYHYDNRTRLYTNIPTKLAKAFCFILVPYEKCTLAIVDNIEYKSLVRTNTLRPITHLLLSNNLEDERALVVRCETINQVYEYMNYPSLETPISYTTCGFSKMRKFYLHKFLRGSRLVDNGSFVKVDYGARNWKECVIKNAVTNIDNIVFKDNLAALVPHLMPQRYTEEELNAALTTTEDHLFIIKPVGTTAFSGIGISIIRTWDEYLKAKKLIEGKWDRFVIQDYVSSPVLFDNKKFHLRVFVIVTSWGKHYLRPEARIVTAKKEYPSEICESQDGNQIANLRYDDKDIHDSHVKSTDGDYFYPQEAARLSVADLPIQLWLQNMFNDVFALIKPKPFPESKFGYELLGADVLVTKDGLKLLEINNGLGFTWIEKGYSQGHQENDYRFTKWEIGILADVMPEVKRKP